MPVTKCLEPSDWQALLEDDADVNTGEWPHLEQCPRCREVLQELAADAAVWKNTIRLLRETKIDNPPEPALQAVMRQIKLGVEIKHPEAPEEWTLPDGFLQPANRPELLGQVDGFEVHEILGQGGTSIVLKAWDRRLHRWVALKVLAPVLAGNANARKRFVREGRAAAAIQHENVIAVYGVEESAGLPYLVLQYIPGETLQDRLDRHGPLPVKEIVDLALKISQGLTAAHAQGVIHRDIKPANILLQKCENGSFVPKISDFGLARSVDDVGCTQHGTVVGTPLYMAPEQARGEKVDERADLFSFGAVLYALAAGHPPFQADSTLATLKAIAEETPAALGRLRSDIPAPFERFILKLLEKRPAQRSSSALETSQWLKQFQAHLQTGSEPAPLPTRSAPQRRWLLAAGLLLATCLGLSEGTGFTNLLENLAVTLRLRTPDGTLVVEVDDPQIVVQIDGTNLVITGAGAKEFHLKPDTYRLITRKQGQAVKTEVVTLRRGDKEIVRITLEPAEAIGDGTVYPLPNMTVGVAFAPGGKTLAVSCIDRVVHVLDLATGKTKRLPGHKQPAVQAVAFTSDGKRLASASGTWEDRHRPGEVKLWDLASGEELVSFTGHQGFVQAIAISPDDKTLAAVSWDQTAWLWALATGKKRAVLRGHQRAVRGLAFAPDGKTLFTASDDLTVKVWDTSNGKELKSLPTTLSRSSINAFALSPDGQTVAVSEGGAADDAPTGRFQVWNLEAGTLLTDVKIATGRGLDLAFAPNGRTLAVASGRLMQSGEVTFWDTTTWQPRGQFSGFRNYVQRLAFCDDGKHLAATGLPDAGPGGVKVWDLADPVVRLKSR